MTDQKTAQQHCDQLSLVDYAGPRMPAVIEFLEGIARGQYPDSDLESLHKAYQSVARALLEQIRSDSDGEDKTT